VRDANDILLDEGLDGLRARFDAAQPKRNSGKSSAHNGKSNGHEHSDATLEFDDQIELSTRVDAIVKDVLHPGDTGVLYGPSGSGKTFAIIQLAYHVALGFNWNGHKVPAPAPVLYVGLEGARGVQKRMLACKRKYGSAGKFFARMTVSPVLNKSGIGDEGQAAIIQQARLLEAKAGQRVGLIIIDTTARAMAGDDENSAQDMSAYVARKAAISQATGAAVLSVHHTGKDEGRGMRGSNALYAACDAVLKINTNGDTREVFAEKVKDGEARSLFSFRLERVELGVDEDGDPITTCTVERVEAAAGGARRAKRPDASTASGKALNELEHLLIAGKDKTLNGHPRVPDGVRVVNRDAWRDACRQARLSTGDEERENRAFLRSQQDLEKRGLIAVHGSFVWPLGRCSHAS
jgi:hypothetical protein